MSVDATSMVIPGHGTVFHAAPGTKPPTNPLTSFPLIGTPPTGWTNLGHTSVANTIAFTKEGGEKTTINTFLMDAVRVQFSPVSWGLTIPALQIDQDVLDFAYNGDFDETTGGYIIPGSVAPVETALFILFQDVVTSLGFWIPNTEVALGDAPSVDTANFFEVPLAAAIKPSDEIPPVNGRPGVYEMFRTGLTDAVPAG